MLGKKSVNEEGTTEQHSLNHRSHRIWILQTITLHEVALKLCLCMSWQGSGGGGIGGRGWSVDDGRGSEMTHIWSCLATARSCFLSTQRVQCACLDFIERATLCGGGFNSRVVWSRKQEEHKCSQIEEAKSREEKLELNVAMSARGSGKE